MQCLKGNGPDDLMSIVYHLGEKALKLSGVKNPEKKLRNAISNGSALNKFREMVEAHGGSIDSLDETNTHKPKYCEKVYAITNGYITSMDTLGLGMAIVDLGGGRIQKGDILDPTVGILFHKKIDDVVKAGEPLLDIFCSDSEKLKIGYERVKSAIQIGREKIINHPLILS